MVAEMLYNHRNNLLYDIYHYHRFFFGLVTYGVLDAKQWMELLVVDTSIGR